MIFLSLPVVFILPPLCPNDDCEVEVEIEVASLYNCDIVLSILFPIKEMFVWDFVWERGSGRGRDGTAGGVLSSEFQRVSERTLLSGWGRSPMSTSILIIS